MDLSIIIPCFNEERTIDILLTRIHEQLIGQTFSYEVVVVDDGSTDRSATLIEKHFSNVKLLRQSNQGKGAAVKAGVEVSLGHFILVQDADLEYHPEDIPKLFERAKNNTSVYGSRMLHINQAGAYRYKFPKGYSFTSRVASTLLSLLHLILYGKFISDTLTGYKIYHRDFYNSSNIATSGFETDHELTAKLLRKGYTICEIPIRFTPRTVADGKKINVFDFIKAVWVIFRFRFK